MKCESKANISWQRRSWSYAYEPLIEVCVFLGRPAFIELSSGFHARRIDLDFFSSGVLLQRRRKTGRKNEENIWRRRISFFLEEKKKRRKRRKRSLQKLSRILRSLSFGRGLETFSNFCRVLLLVSENLVLEKKSHIWFRKIWSRKKSISFGFGEFSLRKKVLISVSNNFA